MGTRIVVLDLLGQLGSLQRLALNLGPRKCLIQCGGLGRAERRQQVIYTLPCVSRRLKYSAAHSGLRSCSRALVSCEELGRAMRTGQCLEEGTGTASVQRHNSLDHGGTRGKKAEEEAGTDGQTGVRKVRHLP
jgi:hypothetical protein